MKRDKLILYRRSGTTNKSKETYKYEKRPFEKMYAYE